ncbi:regulator of RNase E activity RraA [Peribacillus deserti]|uniref:Putative 4-hydroxy-4-methyl-2-oxoglutarate aldolase n=1 Tax=Peribacillus deserti TaxID=673318 RepID=A0ABS2QEY5_9BACI|nr:RraA family protein [Peribacillus deserti]MBM7691693.1 regulator of RNase E activity RraA [Peribacillus deserti]
MGNVGFRIKKDFERIDPIIVKQFRGIATSNIGDVMGRLWAMDHRIKPVNHPGIHLVGSAFTVRTHPSDNLLVHKAMDLAQPGDVIVIDAFGDMGNAILGEIMCHYAKTKGIAGYVVDGPVRDLDGIAKMGFPVFSKGGTPRGPYKEGPGEINTIISCGNVPVEPGDLIVGDGDGVIVVPKAEALEILEKAKAVERQESEIIQSIYNGQWDRKWVDDVLNKKGCEILD